MKNQKQIMVNSYKTTEGFIYDYQKLVTDTIIPYQYQVLNDKAEGASKSHVVANFVNAGKSVKGEDVGDGFYGQVFQDSDAAKWIEAVAYSLSVIPDAELEKIADDLIEKIKAAQDTDGYLNTYFTIKDKDKRWTNLLEGHELYCAGHMIEAACAYFEATGKRTLLDVMQKNVDHIYKTFIENNHPGYPGHPEVELALMKMYRLTKDKKCLELAKHFVDIRGVDNQFYVKEQNARSWTVWGNDGANGDYQQSSMPVRDLKDARGHAVRAVYLYTGMADVATETDDKELFDACQTLWDSITKRQLYITGGIGSTVHGEAFSVDYDLPSDTAYNETCASIGLVFFASRMLEKDVDRKYSDVMERAFYNTVLGGIQMDGKKYFYVNPLEVVPGISGVSPTHRHDLPQRPGWYDCACCPPNAARMITSFGKYAYSENDSTAFCHMYAAGDVQFENGINISCETKYPYELKIRYKVNKGQGTLAVRIPGWSAEDYKINTTCEYTIDKGYAYIKVAAGEEIEIVLKQDAYFVYPSTKVSRLTSQVALCRGPLVYCFEGVDNDEDVLTLAFADDAVTSAEYITVDSLGGVTGIKLPAKKSSSDKTELYVMTRPTYQDYTAIAVPYYTWGNRGLNQMRVWIPNR